MNKQKVVIVRSTYPYSDSRLLKTINYLLKSNFEVTVIGWNRQNAKEHGIISYNENIANIILYDVPSPHGLGIKGFSKLIGFNRWIKKQLKRCGKVDFIHACDLDTGYTCCKFARKHKIKFIYDIYDYYVGSRKIPKPLKKILEKQEIKVINKADTVILCTEERKDEIKKATPKSVEIIYNTPNIEQISKKKVIIEENDNCRLKLCYVGVLSNVRLLKEIIDEIENHQDVELHIGGIGPLSEEVAKKAQELNNVYYYGRMNYHDVLALEKDCDVLFATYNPEIKGHKYSAPNKIYEAMGLSKPIIVCENTSIDKVVLENKCGLVCKYDAIDFFEQCEILKDESLRNMYSKNALVAYDNKYSWNNNEITYNRIYNLK